MAKYKSSVGVQGGLYPLGSFPIAHADNIEMGDGSTLSETAQEISGELEAFIIRVNTLLDSDDTTLDQLSEIVAYIKSNKNLIDAITTSKVSITDIVNDLKTNATNKPLSAAMGAFLAKEIENLRVAPVVSWNNLTDKPFDENNPLDKKYLPDISEGDLPILETDEDGAWKIKGQYLPESTGGGVSSWNDLTDKPFYDNSVEISIDHSTIDTSESAFRFQLDDGTCLRISEQTMSAEQLLGATFTATLVNGETMSAVVEQSNILFASEDVTILFMLDQLPLIVAYKAGDIYVSIPGMMLEGTFNVPAPGFYTFEELALYITNSSVKKEDIKKLDKKYLPAEPVTVDMSQFESAGKIIETYADGTSKTTTIDFDSLGNPTKITDGDGHVTNFTW